MLWIFTYIHRTMCEFASIHPRWFAISRVFTVDLCKRIFPRIPYLSVGALDWYVLDCPPYLCISLPCDVLCVCVFFLDWLKLVFISVTYICLRAALRVLFRGSEQHKSITHLDCRHWQILDVWFTYIWVYFVFPGIDLCVENIYTILV